MSSEPDSHYCFIDIFRAKAAQGFEVHIYPPRYNEEYELLGDSHANIYYHYRIKPEHLYAELLRYDYGWCRFYDAINKLHLDTVLPNKFFEYIACRLPA